MLATTNPSSFLIAQLIEAYQRFISPYKGFRCAHRAVHGKDSCSQFAKRVVTRRGILAMFPLLRRRFTECGVAAQVLDYEARETTRHQAQTTQKRHQGCDASPDAADVAECVGDAACNSLSTADCSPPSADCTPGFDCTPDVSCDVF